MGPWVVFRPEGTAPPSDAPTHPVEFVSQGITLQVPEDVPLLDAAEAAGQTLPFSCRAGICTSCLAKVSGEVNQPDAHALTEGEKAGGWVLLCVAYPRGALTVATQRARNRRPRPPPRE